MLTELPEPGRPATGAGHDHHRTITDERREQLGYTKEATKIWDKRKENGTSVAARLDRWYNTYLVEI